MGVKGRERELNIVILGAFYQLEWECLLFNTSHEILSLILYSTVLLGMLHLTVFRLLISLFRGFETRHFDLCTI